MLIDIINKTFLYPLLVLTFFLAGCQVGPKYHPPINDAPAEWKSPQEIPEELPSICYWWEVFQDEVLSSLEEEAIGNNPTLFVALARVEEAWSVAGKEKANLFPQLNLNPSFQDIGVLFKIYLPNNNPAIEQAIGLVAPYRIHQFNYGFPLNMNYEIDLWGKNQSLYDSAFASAVATDEAYQAAMLTLTTDVASSYYNLQALDATALLLKKIVATREKDYKLTQSRFDNGLIDALALNSSFEELTNAESDYFNALGQRGVQENVLATLIGRPSSDFHWEIKELTSLPPRIPAGIPSDVIKRRPDIAQAERTMQAQNAEIKAAYASLLPSFQLTGALGYISPDFQDFFKWISRYWMLGIAANQTIFDGGRKFAEVDSSWAEFWQASGNYKQTVLTAFQEVENALTSLEYQKKQSDSIFQNLEAAKRSFALSKNRHTKGLVNNTESINYERVQLNAELIHINLIGQQYQSTLQLIKALGGGFGQSGDLLPEEESCEG